eukprot:m.1026473 g.1026473  ORF g.1026473 m.1026473 type:complete len:79 (+) comp24108_c0_seq22:1815-2051(+)
MFLVVAIMWVTRLRNFRAFLRTDGGANNDGSDGADPKAPCTIVKRPGGPYAVELGVEVRTWHYTSQILHAVAAFFSFV